MRYPTHFLALVICSSALLFSAGASGQIFKPLRPADPPPPPPTPQGTIHQQAQQPLHLQRLVPMGISPSLDGTGRTVLGPSRPLELNKATISFRGVITENVSLVNPYGNDHVSLFEKMGPEAGTASPGFTIAMYVTQGQRHQIDCRMSGNYVTVKVAIANTYFEGLQGNTSPVVNTMLFPGGVHHAIFSTNPAPQSGVLFVDYSWDAANAPQGGPVDFWYCEILPYKVQ